MKTIEERVNESWGEYTYRDTPDHNLYSSVYEDGYIKGATDQQKIDRERVCKWICTSCECAENCEFSSPANCPTIKSITKAMEGEE